MTSRKQSPSSESGLLTCRKPIARLGKTFHSRLPKGNEGICGGRITVAKDNRTTRERQVSASQKTANLGLRALEEQKQHLDRAPERECRPMLFCSAPSRGLWERPWFGAPFFVALFSHEAA